jgi:hypothetical protein
VKRIVPILPALLLFLTLVASSSRNALAQFYAPPTDYHDAVQRVFPVEAARILAARENAAVANKFAEIRWNVASTTNQTQWDIAWLNANGATSRLARVSYSAATLLDGPGFYREVFKQLWTNGWSPVTRLTDSAAMAMFWKGAEQTAPSREVSLVAALKIAPPAASPTNVQDSAQLAGLLAHASLPSIVGRLSIDSVLLARSAAWVALLEQSSDSQLPRAWTPILFQAGRETTARELWRTTPSNTQPDSKTVAGVWDLWLGKPNTRDVFLRAVEAPHQAMTIALLAYHTQVAGSGNLLAELIEPLVGEDNLPDLHNYAPFIAVRTGVGGGHIMDGMWPYFQRMAWVELLSKIPATDKEFSRHRDLLRTVSQSLSKKPQPDRASDSSLLGFKETVPLLKLGRDEGSGPLLPTAAVSVRDLLNYGWESAGIQMGGRYRFVARMWGVAEQARPILRTVTGEVEGLIPFFLTQERAKTFNYADSMLRLQLVDGLFDLVGWSPSPFIAKAGPVEGAHLLTRRAWLRSKDFEWHVRNLWDGNLIPEVTRYMEVLRDEGGPLAATEVLQYLTSINKNERTNVPKADVLMPQLGEKLPETTKIHLSAVFQRKYGDKDPFEIAQSLERLYWQDVSSGFENEIFAHYLMAGAYKSARRFFVQTAPYALDPVLVSNTRGSVAFVMGYVLNDPELRRMAMKVSRSGSASDMYMHIWEAAIRDDLPQLKQHVEELIDRYQSRSGADSSGRRVLKFLPLLPALKDPAHPSRSDALRYFGNEPGWTILRWIWIEKYKLPKADAVTFLGGRETDAFRHILVCSLEGNAEAAKAALKPYADSVPRFNEQLFLAYHLTHQLQKAQFNKDEPDLKPAQVVSISEAVLARLKSKSR